MLSGLDSGEACESASGAALTSDDNPVLVERTFYLAKGKPWHFVALGLALAGHLVIATLHFGKTGSVSLANVFPVLILVPFAAFALRGHYDRRPVLKITSQGIWLSAWHQPSPIPWASIVSIKERTFGPGEPLIALETDTERPLSRDHLPRCSFRVTQFDIRHEDAMRLIKEYWRVSADGGGAARD